MYVAGSVFFVLGASLVNLCSSSDARLEGEEAPWFNDKIALTKV